MMRSTGCCQAAIFCLGVLIWSPFGGAKAQIPPPVPNEPAEINACVCLHAASAALAGEKDAKAQALAAVDRQLADLNAQMAGEKPRVDVNSPASVSSYKVLLQRRDAAFGQLAPAQAAAAQAVERYNATVDEYNRRCIRPFNPDLWAQISAHPNCPPFR
ncbi:MAG TPA: hypothetical protein VNW89_15470 [Stellaceae bacterium]|jgi:hypothetical protein|nr:hypothetical protein [Stellaceae bacterium]